MIANNYEKILDQIAKAAITAGRDPAEVRLVVVTKGHSVEAVKKAVEAGARFLGENYLEEAIPKIESLSGVSDIEWHMVGHIQSRKARTVCQYFHRVESVDRIKLATRLNRFASEIKKKIPVLLECNVSGETSKYGFPAWDEKHWPELLPEFENIVDFPALKVCGLMTMPPYFSNVDDVRPYFQRLVRLQDYLSKKITKIDLKELSMGVSNDFEIAIQEGATIVRIGTAIMGKRNSKIKEGLWDS